MKQLRIWALVVAIAVMSSPIPAVAYARDAGDEPGAGMSVLETVGFFVLLPLGIWGVIWLLWSIPKWRRDAGPVAGDAWDPSPSRDVVNR